MTLLQYALDLKTAAFTGPMHAAQGTVKGFSNQLSNVGNIVSGLANIPNAIQTLVAPLSKPITLAADVEVLGKSFKTLLGSGSEAVQMLKEVTQFSGSTPFQITEVAPAAKQLLAFGFAAKQVLPLMQDIGDMSALMDKPINEVADAFGRLKSGQFGEAFERMRAFGLSMKDLQGAGLVFDKSGSFVGSADQAIEAVRQIIRRKFGGGMKEISGTFKGQFSNLTDAWEQLQTNFGKPITGALTPVLSEVTKNMGDWTPAATNFGKTLATGISGAFALFKSGDLGDVLKTSMAGIGSAFFQNFGVGLSAAIRAGAAVLKGGFQSAVALFSNASFWDGIRGSALSIAYSVKSIILDVAADLVSMLPNKAGVAAEWKKTSKSTQGLADAYQQNAAANFDNVDFDKVVQPLINSAGSAGAILGDAITQIATNLKNNTAASQFADSLRNAAAGKDAFSQISGAPLYDLVPPKREFLPVADSFQFDNGNGIMGQENFLASVRKLIGSAPENLMNPRGIGSGEGAKAADIKKSIDDSGLIKRLISLLEQVQNNTSKIGGDLVYGY